MKTLPALIVAAVYTGAMLWAAWNLIKVRAELDKTKNELFASRVRLRKTEQEALDLVQKVTPLVEKTDWMTGRWNGQFSTLVEMENKRNTAVEEARRTIWSIPLVADYIANALNHSGEDK